MKAISIKQPWASLIAVGEKTIECRSWQTHYRGDLLICSSLSKERVKFLPLLGKALSVVELYDIQHFTPEDINQAYLPENLIPKALSGYAWKLRLKYEVIPFDVKGKLNFYEIDDALIKKLPNNFKSHLDYLKKKHALSISPIDLKKKL